MKKDIRSILRESFKDPGYRNTYAQESLYSLFAAQLVTIRQFRGLTQQALAEKAGVGLWIVRRYENVNNKLFSVSVLFKLAAALDVPLVLQFGTFGELIEQAALLEQKGTAFLKRPTFEQESQEPWEYEPGALGEMRRLLIPWLRKRHRIVEPLANWCSGVGLPAVAPEELQPYSEFILKAARYDQEGVRILKGRAKRALQLLGLSQECRKNLQAIING